MCIRDRPTTKNCGIATLGKLHQLLDKLLLLRRRRYVVKNLVLHRTVNAHILCRAVVRYLIVKCRQLRHLNEVQMCIRDRCSIGFAI